MWMKILSALGLIAVLIAIAVGGGIGKIVGRSVGEATFGTSKPTQQQIDEALIKGFRQASEQSNRNSPQMVDKDTRLDTTTVGPGARLTYFYTLINYTSRDITASWLDQNLKSTLKNRVCTNVDVKLSLQYGATYVYVYRGNDGAEISRFTFNRHRCNLPSVQ